MSTNEWEYHFATLDEEDRADPFTVIASFCHDDTPFGARKTFFEIFNAAMLYHESRIEYAKDESGWIWFFKITLKLIEAAYLINDLRETEQLTYSMKGEVPSVDLSLQESQDDYIETLKRNYDTLNHSLDLVIESNRILAATNKTLLETQSQLIAKLKELTEE